MCWKRRKRSLRSVQTLDCESLWKDVAKLKSLYCNKYWIMKVKPRTIKVKKSKTKIKIILE